MDDELKASLVELTDTLMGPGVAATKALYWLVAYLAENGQAQAMLDHLNADTWQSQSGKHQPVLDALKTGLAESLQDIIAAGPHL